MIRKLATSTLLAVAIPMLAFASPARVQSTRQVRRTVVSQAAAPAAAPAAEASKTEMKSETKSEKKVKKTHVKKGAEPKSAAPVETK